MQTVHIQKIGNICTFGNLENYELDLVTYTFHVTTPTEGGAGYLGLGTPLSAG